MVERARFDINFRAQWPPWDGPRDGDWLVGQKEWTSLIPLLHQTLANPEGPHAWPYYDRASELEEACCYWTAAAYLCVVLLGWEDLGLGLRRLLKSGTPPRPSPHLDLLLQVWNDRSQLGLLGLWAWEQSPRFRGRTTRDDDWPKRSAETFLGEEWHQHFSRQFPEHGGVFRHDPYHGGYDPLHLSMHLGGAFDTFEDDPPLLLQRAPEQRRAVLLLDRMNGWMNALCSATSALEDVGPRSWHVDVIVRPVGWLSTFRQSRVTGRWFTGTHTVHMMGSRTLPGSTGGQGVGVE
jgi:hypothetical protein